MPLGCPAGPPGAARGKTLGDAGKMLHQEPLCLLEIWGTAMTTGNPGSLGKIQAASQVQKKGEGDAECC